MAIQNSFSNSIQGVYEPLPTTYTGHKPLSINKFNFPYVRSCSGRMPGECSICPSEFDQIAFPKPPSLPGLFAQILKFCHSTLCKFRSSARPTCSTTTAERAGWWITGRRRCWLMDHYILGVCVDECKSSAHTQVLTYGGVDTEMRAKNRVFCER